MGENLANNQLPHVNVVQTTHVRITRITPAVMKINLSQETIKRAITKLKANKTCGPGRVAPKCSNLQAMIFYQSSSLYTVLVLALTSCPTHGSPLMSQRNTRKATRQIKITIDQYPYSAYLKNAWRLVLRCIYSHTTDEHNH